MADQDAVPIACASEDLTAVLYCAPLSSFDNPKKEADLYMVYLAPGHSLDQHQQEAGLEELAVVYENYSQNILDNTIYVYATFYPDKLCYIARLAASQLERVRGNTGVELVECIVKFRL
ncbi:hypothetical protein LTR85_010131 [Meristemomyces frigidus]|nr:hypothetical protein LTR85_010131 [Meristemomyces frigidus]